MGVFMKDDDGDEDSWLMSDGVSGLYATGKEVGKEKGLTAINVCVLCMTCMNIRGLDMATSRMLWTMDGGQQAYLCRLLYFLYG